MFNWKRLCSYESGFEGVHDELRAGNGLYILDNVNMPETCGDCVCTIEFKYYSENRIVLTCSGAPVDYLGTDNQIAEWLTTGAKEFGNFDEVKTFLSKFKSDRCLNSEEDDVIPVSVVENDTSAEVAKPRPKVKYDKDKHQDFPHNS